MNTIARVSVQPVDTDEVKPRPPSLQERVWAIIPLFDSITFGSLHRAMPEVGHVALEHAVRALLNTGALVRDVNAYKRGRRQLRTVATL